MKVTIITCFESNEERVKCVYDACIKSNYDVSVITSNFSHIRKEKRNNIPEGYISIDTKPYKKNLSVSRMVSHSKFAKDTFKKVEEIDPDLIWLMAPANSLIKEANTYEKNHNAKIIIDMIDMWPESLPININKNVFPFNIWRNIRKNNINCADKLVSECDFYKDILGTEYNKTIHTLYWPRVKYENTQKLDLPEDKLSLCYLGSINNIIDIDRIYKLIESADKPVILHIIGEGERKDEFVDKLNKICSVEYHGSIRDDDKKEEILKKCHAGINVYKEGLYIGLTVKCIDYFNHGLPIINSIKGDTWKFIENNRVGININSNTTLKYENIKEMRLNNQNIYDLFDNNFSKDVFEKKCIEIIDEAINK